MSIVVAFDPGLTGAIAVVDALGRTTCNFLALISRPL
jgi:predicted RNase H-like nuclease (RuvC/YqgF family)